MFHPHLDSQTITLSHTHTHAPPSFALFPRRHSAIHHTHTHTIQKGSHTPFSFTGRHRLLVCRNVDDLINRGTATRRLQCPNALCFFWHFTCFASRILESVVDWCVTESYLNASSCVIICRPPQGFHSRQKPACRLIISFNPSASSDSFTASPQITVVLLHLIRWLSFS